MGPDDNTINSGFRMYLDNNEICTEIGVSQCTFDASVLHGCNRRLSPNAPHDMVAEPPAHVGDCSARGTAGGLAMLRAWRTVALMCFALTLQFVTACMPTKRSVVNGDAGGALWASMLPVADRGTAPRLGVRYADLKRLRPQAISVPSVGLGEYIGRWRVTFDFLGDRSWDALTIMERVEPAADAPLARIEAISFHRTGREASAEWATIVAAWKRAGAALECRRFRDRDGSGRVAFFGSGRDTTAVSYNDLAPGWSGPRDATDGVEPLGHVLIEVTPRLRPVFAGASASTVRCPDVR